MNSEKNQPEMTKKGRHDLHKKEKRLENNPGKNINLEINSGADQ